jgi:two-component system response regulator HydG
MNSVDNAKLLIVDDNEGVRHLVSRWLEKAGFSVREAKDGAEAVEMVKEDPPDIKIILMTAYSSPQTIAQARREGVDDYLEKPFTKDQVERITMETLSG